MNQQIEQPNFEGRGDEDARSAASKASANEVMFESRISDIEMAQGQEEGATMPSMFGEPEWIPGIGGVPDGEAENDILRWDDTDKAWEPEALPDIDSGTTANDLLRWNGTKWTRLAAPSISGTWVLMVVGGSMQWVEGSTMVCS